MLCNIIVLEGENDTQAAKNGALMPTKTPAVNFRLTTNLYVNLAFLCYLSLRLIVFFQIQRM